MHAADVCQSMHALLVSTGLIGQFDKRDVFAAFVAALVHDYDHPAVTNKYLIKVISFAPFFFAFPLCSCEVGGSEGHGDGFWAIPCSGGSCICRCGAWLRL